MQKKHLHILLLFWLLAGCGHRNFNADNPYFINYNDIVATPTRDDPACLMGNASELRIGGRSVPVFDMRLPDVADGVLSGYWQDKDFGSVAMSGRNITRTLTEIVLEDSSAGLRARSSLLPGGHGISFFLDGRPLSTLHFVLQSESREDSLLWQPPRRMSEQVLLFQRVDGSCLAVAINAKRLAAQPAPSDSSGHPAWIFSMEARERRHVVLATGTDAQDAAKRARKYLGFSPERMAHEAAARLRKQVAFSLRTEDERSNRVFASLATALPGDDPSKLDNAAAISAAAQNAAAYFLAARNMPDELLKASNNDRTRRERLRWSVPGWRSALEWGMDTTHHPERAAGELVNDIAQLQSDYKNDGWPVFDDQTVADSALRAVAAEVQRASALTLADEICTWRGDRGAQADMRRETLKATHEARQRFTNIARAYAQEQNNPPDVHDADTLEELVAPGPSSFPDTVLLLELGARYGFQILHDRPGVFWNSHPAVDGFTWLKWVEFRFHNEPGLRETNDFDSLSAMLLDGAVPGMLSENPRYVGEPSRTVMAAAFENLATVYLGMRPEAYRRKLTLEPRPPRSWGHTQARIPYAEGFITLDLNFAHRYAIVGQEGLLSDVDVVFGYPLESGGFMRGQFTLEASKHATRIDLEKQSDNMQRLRLNEVP